MKDIKVLGTGCVKCQMTVRLVEEAAKAKGEEIALEKIEDIEKIMAYDIVATPAVVIDGKVVHAGGIPARDKVKSWF